MNRHDLTSVLRQDPSSPQPAGEAEAQLAARLAKELGLKKPPSVESRAALAGSERLAILNDQPATSDRFGFGPFVRALCDIVLSESSQTPLAIALDGRWGTGKTSVMRMVESQARLAGFPCIWLNAWSLEGTENLLAAVGAEIQREARRLDKDSGSVTDSVRSTLRSASRALSWFTSAGAQLAELLADRVKDRESELAELASVVTANRSFEELVHILLRSPSSGKDVSSRLIVFIDDLDRALPDQIANTLRTLKLVLESPRCVFILAMDMAVVARAIEQHYSSAAAARDVRGLEAAAAYEPEHDEDVGRSFGFSYLEKLVQIRVEIPRLTPRVAREFLEDQQFNPQIIEIVRWAPPEETTNPRRLKQYLNWLTMNLQFIVGASLPEGLTNHLALRFLALRRSYPLAYQQFLGARTKQESREILYSALSAGRERGELEEDGGGLQRLRAYCEELALPQLARRFADFLGNEPLLVGAVGKEQPASGAFLPLSRAEASRRRAFDPADHLLLIDAVGLERILLGAEKLATAVQGTLGPQGRKVAVTVKDGRPSFLSDSLSIAQKVVLKDALENFGAGLVREAGARTVEAFGDGATTAMILARSILREVILAVRRGANAVAVRRGVEIAVKAALAAVEEVAVPVEGKHVNQVGSAAAGFDPEIGLLIAEAMEKVGKDGVIMVEEARGLDTTLEVVEGMQFDRGYLSPYFVTDAERREAVLEGCKVLLHEKKISSMKELLPVLEQIAKQGRPLLIVAEDVDGEALATLVVNKLRGTLHVAACKAPGFGDRRKGILEDIAVLTGGKVITEDLGIKLENVHLEDLGDAKKVVLTKADTVIVTDSDDARRREAIANRVKQIRNQIETTTSDYDREKLQDRLAKLVGGVALIKVGAATETEMKEKKVRVEDAMHATKAAIEQGIVPGGGVALLIASRALSKLREEGDALLGVQAVRKSLEEPLRQIVENAGLEGAVILEEVLTRGGSAGFDALQSKFVDVVATGLIDPSAVVQAALSNAAEAVILGLTTDALVLESEQDEPAAPGTLESSTEKPSK
jgi:chaperonin GroEL